MNLRLRLAETADHERVANILIDARAAFMPYAPSAHAEHEVRDWVRDHLIPTGNVTLATVNEDVVGVMAVSHSDGYSWIDQMYVQPSLVGRGIGTKLLQHALAVLSSPIRLYTFQANTGARRFYERNGFHIIELTDGQANEEHCPDVLYEHRSTSKVGG